MSGVSLEQDERFTLRDTMRWVSAVTGVRRFNLDVAACRESHWARRYYTVRQNGLVHPWDARFVWCNPPYSHIEPWIRRAWQATLEHEAEKVCMLIPASRTEQPWWQGLVEPWRDRKRRGHVQLTSHFPPGRTRFGHPGNPTGVDVGSPPFACVLLVFSSLVQTSAHRGAA